LTRTAHPTGPFLATLFAGVLMLSNGIILWIAWAAALSTTYAPYGNPLEALALFEGFLGVVVILLATVLFVDPRHPFGFGVAIIALSLLSFFGGGGFYLGIGLGLFGGIWALWVEPVGPGVPAVPPSPRAIDQICPRCSLRYSGSASVCPFCGANPQVAHQQPA